MRHKLKHRKLNRTSSHRRALLRNMSIALVTHERIRTTVAKAKELRPFIEKLVTKGRNNNLYYKRYLFSILRDNNIVDKLINNIAQRFQNRPGGYVRIMKNGFRYGDAAPMAIIEFVDYSSENKTE